MTPETITLEYLGKTPRTFPLPIPFVALSAQTGAVTCDPIGVFPAEDAERLLQMAPGAFRRVHLDGDEAAAAPPPMKPKKVFTVPKLPPLNRATEPMLHEKLNRALRRRIFRNAGVATFQRNKYLPGAIVQKRADGRWEIVDAPSPPLAEGAEGSNRTAVPPQAKAGE